MLAGPGFVPGRAASGEERQQFGDVAAVAYYLRVVSWAIPEFTPDTCRERLRAAHDRPGLWPATVRQRRFLLIADKRSRPVTRKS